MREDCVHYETRTYDGGEVARFCTKDLAPEAPWRCPEGCPAYERLLIAGDFDRGSLGKAPQVGDEPDASSDDIASILDDAEDIVNAAAPGILTELDRERPRRPWWRRRGGSSEGGFGQRGR